MKAAELAARIDALLPQTQCTHCGYSGCMPYAEAIAAGAADINRCAPGGAAAIGKLAALTGREAKPLDPACGEHKPRALAHIDEARCIGCTLCIQACPIDAIVGATKLMHSVLAQHCSGCELCLPVCPVDCIAMLPLAGTRAGETPADDWRKRHAFRKERLLREQNEREARLARRADAQSAASEGEAKRAVILAAIARAQARRAGREEARAGRRSTPRRGGNE